MSATRTPPTAVPATADYAALAARAAQVELDVYPRLPFLPVRGEGCHLFDADGTPYLDMYAGHAVALTGHCHPHVVAAVQRQAAELFFYSNAVHCPTRIRASELLLAEAPAGSRVFYCCSGSEANENAMKIARKVTGRRKIVSFERSFHGRTVATLSASGLPKYQATAGGVLLGDHVHVPFGDVDALKAAVDGDTAGVLCETIQSLGGLYMATPEYYRAMAEITRAAGALLIYDEVQAGLGRTGTFYFGAGVGVEPDLVTLAKGIASGLPVGAVVVGPRAVPHIHSGDQGSTFGGGPVPMAAMQATLEVIAREHLAENAARVGAQLVAALGKLPGVREVRGKGLLLGIEFDGPCAPVQKALLARHILTGNSSHPNVMRLLPPLVLNGEQAGQFVRALAEVLAEGAGGPA